MMVISYLWENYLLDLNEAIFFFFAEITHADSYKIQQGKWDEHYTFTAAVNKLIIIATYN